MSDLRQSASGEEGPTISKPWWLALVIIAIGAVWLCGGARLPQTSAYAGIGPGAFVTIVGATIVTLGCILLVQIGRGAQFEPQEAEDALPDGPVSRSGLALSLAASVVPLAAIQHLGFPLTAVIVFVLTARAFGSKKPFLDAAIGAALAAVTWFGFGWLGLALGGFLPLLGR